MLLAPLNILSLLIRMPKSSMLRGKRFPPGLINCHTHLLATLDRGILEEFGFPIRLRIPITARSLMTREERRTMAAFGSVRTTSRWRHRITRVCKGKILARPATPS